MQQELDRASFFCLFFSSGFSLNVCLLLSTHATSTINYLCIVRWNIVLLSNVFVFLPETWMYIDDLIETTFQTRNWKSLRWHLMDSWRKCKVVFKYQCITMNVLISAKGAGHVWTTKSYRSMHSDALKLPGHHRRFWFPRVRLQIFF